MHLRRLPLVVKVQKVIDMEKRYKDLLSVQDLSELFEVSKQTIYKELKAGKFGSPIKIGRAYKVPKTFIERHFFDKKDC